MRHCEHNEKADGSPVSTQEEIDANFTAFEEAKKRRHRNTEMGGDVQMMDSDVIVKDDELSDFINIVLYKITNDGNCTYEWSFKQIGVVIDDAKHEIMYDVSRHKHYVHNQIKDTKSRKNRVKKLSQMLLDSQHTCDAIIKKDFLSKIRYFKWTLRLQNQAGEFRINHIGDILRVGRFWFYPEGIDNILSRHRMSAFSK